LWFVIWHTHAFCPKKDTFPGLDGNDPRAFQPPTQFMISIYQKCAKKCSHNSKQPGGCFFQATFPLQTPIWAALQTSKLTKARSQKLCCHKQWFNVSDLRTIHHKISIRCNKMPEIQIPIWNANKMLMFCKTMHAT